ncbi:MAG TPA: CRTAC1 family protein [Acidobacteriota bacterium]|nr:CRTAC1 family protein [Acidobacteriota bacterium]
MNRPRIRLRTLLLIAAIMAFLHGQSEVPPSFSFRDAAAQAGLDQLTVYGGRDTNKYLLETTGCGAALIDYDNDGDLDVYLVNGSRLEGYPQGKAPTGHFYRNRGDGTFEDVTEASGLAVAGWGQAACVGDYDNDGWEDLFLTFYGQNRLFRNRSDGTFQEVTEKAGLAQDRLRWNVGCSFLDGDNDGHLDLFVGNYIDLDLETAPTPDSGACRYKGVPVACGPPGLQGGTNLYYRNRGDGTFQDASRSSGIAAANGTYALGAVTADFNNDGWMDIYVANDSNPAALYQNQGDGKFQDLGILAGVAFSQDGKPQAGMGVSAGDVDNDGDIDLFKTNFAEDTVNLYLNSNQGFFEDATFKAGLGINTRFLGWGCGLHDFDNDGWLDIFEVNGHVYPEVLNLGDSTSYQQRKVIYRNLRNGRFEDVSEKVGSAVMQPRAGRGAAFGDIDNDGDIDVVVNNVHQRPSLYLNEVKAPHNWVQVRPLGSASNKSGIGARVRLRAGGLTRVDEVRSGGSYYSQNQLRLHFGLGMAEKIDWMEIRWPGGKTQRFEDLPLNRILYVVEGQQQVYQAHPGAQRKAPASTPD